jgi:hypothetical protein
MRRDFTFTEKLYNEKENVNTNDFYMARILSIIMAYQDIARREAGVAK